MAKALKKGTKIIIIVLVVLTILAATGLGVAFGIVNSLKFMSYTKAKLTRFAEEYPSHTVQFIAHRGLSVEEYQNTVEAFRLAAEDEGTWGIETDVWATSDGGFVCMHDGDAISGVSNVRNVTLKEATSTPLKDNGERYAANFDEYLEICKQGDKTAVIEIKDKNMTETDLDLLMQKVQASGVEFRFISFHFEKLKYIRDNMPSAKLQYLVVSTHVGHKKLNEAISLKIDLSCMYQLLTKKMVQKFHDAGLEVGVWTVNIPRDAMCCVSEFDVDYVTTDIRMDKEIDSYIATL